MLKVTERNTVREIVEIISDDEIIISQNFNKCAMLQHSFLKKAVCSQPVSVKNSANLAAFLSLRDNMEF